MFRRRRPPVLAELPEREGGRARPGSLNRAELDALGAVLRTVDDSPAVLVTGEAAKSALALGLATVAAAAGRRAALVECDLARPSLAPRLGLAATPGLHEYLRGVAEAPETLQPLVLAGPASAGASAPLTCLVGGEPADDSSALLASEEFGHAIAKLRRAYDLVVLDGPPPLDEPSLLAAAARADKALFCGSRPAIPKELGIRVDGLVVLA